MSIELQMGVIFSRKMTQAKILNLPSLMKVPQEPQGHHQYSHYQKPIWSLSNSIEREEEI